MPVESVTPAIEGAEPQGIDIAEQGSAEVEDIGEPVSTAQKEPDDSRKKIG